jgi:hypothetical protein
MAEEMRAIHENDTWQLATLPTGHRTIDLKWVYKVKRNEAGEIVRHKACLVAKGYVQHTNINFDEVFTSITRFEFVRMMVALAAHHRWLVHHMDVKSAFLNGSLAEVVYAKQPPGFIAAGNEDKVYRLRKALYGLWQAPRAWNAKLDATLTRLGFQKSCSEHGVYTRSRGGDRLIIGVYVDDLIITGTTVPAIDEFKQEMKEKFQMSDLGLLSYYLGIEVIQGEAGIALCQSAYAAS